ncbi:MAG: BlaI/MecI/CopY family transcriptional regulator [Planctomycetota bacterium]|jgi:predicted transcriptional regulator
MAKKRARLGELELTVLKTIWGHQPCTVQQVANILSKRRGCARTTVLTVMQRLHAKKFLKRRKMGKVFHYTPTEARNKVMSRLVGQFLDKVLDGSPLPFVTYLTEREDLTQEQVATLRAIAKKLESKRKEK